MSSSHPSDLRYHPEHGWARVEQSEATLGITAYAAEQLGEVIYVELPESGASVVQGSPYGAVESAKTFSDLIAPLSGTVLAVNDSLGDSPHAVSDDPYGEGWIARIEIREPEQPGALLDSDAYLGEVGG